MNPDLQSENVNASMARTERALRDAELRYRQPLEDDHVHPANHPWERDFK